MRGIPVVLFGALHPEDHWGFDRNVIRRTIRSATAYAAYTRYEADYVVSLGVAPARVHIVPPGVDPEPFRRAARAERPATEPVVGFFGQMTAHKGLLDLLAAMRIVWERVPGARLVIAGARRAGTASGRAGGRGAPGGAAGARAASRPTCRRRARPELFASFDVFASPSAFESFGITFLEAWAAGLPIVGCRVGAVASVVSEGVDGLLVEPGDPRQLAAALERLLADPAERERLGASGPRGRARPPRLGGDRGAGRRALLVARRGDADARLTCAAAPGRGRRPPLCAVDERDRLAGGGAGRPTGSQMSSRTRRSTRTSRLADGCRARP